MYIYITNPLLLLDIDSAYSRSLLYIYITNPLLLRNNDGA